MILIDAKLRHRELDFSPRMAAHTRDARNYVELILKQINDGLYERYLPFARDGVVLDLGANVGMTAMYFAAVAKRVVAVEPDPGHIETLMENARVQGFGSIWGIQAAVAKESGYRELNLNPTNPTANSLVFSQGSHEGTLKVSAFSVMDLFRTAKIDEVDFAKVDIEGGELEIAQDLVDAPIRSIFMEYHDGLVGRPIGDEIEAILKKEFNVTRVAGDAFWAVRT